MKQKHRIPAKALSFLLALVMLVGCISVGFTAFAVEDTYQVLAAAIRADGMQGVIPLYKSSTSPGVKSKLAASDPHATSAVYVQSAAMWSAMDAFWKAAGALRSKDVGDIVVGDNGNIYEGWTGENNTARKIASAVAAKLAAGGYMTADEQRLYDVTGIFNWFIGSPTAENALLDAPVRGEKPAFQPWSLQVFGTTGYFGATRTRDQALFAGTKNYKQIPATLELNRRWEWAHDARSASNSAGTVRQYWHVLSKMDTAGNVAGAAGLPFDPAQANTAALKAALSAWDGTFDKAFFKQDLSAMGTDQLNAVKANVEAKILAVKELDVTNSLLYFYGLPTFMDVGTFQRKLDYHLDLAPFRPYVSFFKNAKASKLKNMNMDALSKEVLAARTNYSALQVVQYSSKNIFNGLVEENGLDMAAAEEYVSEVQYEISSPAGRDALVAYVANLINSNLEWDGADDEDGTGSFALKPDFFVWRNADGTQNGAAISLEDLYGLYESLAMANEALIGKIGDTPDFTLKNPEFPGTIPGSSPPEPEPEFIPFRWDVALHEKTGLPYKYAIQYRGADAVNKALSAILQAIADRNPNLYYDYYGKKPPGVNAPYPGFPGISAAYPDGFPNSILPDPPALYEYERLPAGFITKNPNPGKAPSAPAAQGSMSDAAYATLLEGYINNVLTPWNPYIAKPVATKPDRASSPWLGNDVLYISDANLYITQALANWTAADTSTMTTVIWADSLTNPTTTTAFVGTVYDYAAYFIVNPMDTDADFWAWAVGFASDAGFAARLLAVNASYAEQGFTPGDIPDVPNPDDYDVTPHNSIIEAIVDDNGYALAWNDYIQQVIALYDTMVVNYNRWKLTHDWTEYYETYIATVPAAGDPRGAYTPPVAPATEGTYANPVPERKDFPVNKTDPPDMLGDIAYLTAAEAYASGLDAAQLKYIVDIGGVTYGGSVGSVTFATSDIYDVKNPKYVSLAETPLEPEYLPRKDLTEAQSFMLAIGMINWAPNAAYPSGTGQIVDGVTYATEMEARYVYLTKDLPNRMNLNADYANEMKRRLTIPQNAYYNMVQRQMEFEEAIRTGTDADVIAARNKLQTAVSNYNNLLTNGGWTIDGSTNMGIGANNSAYIIPGLADAITDYTAVNNRLTSLRMYGLFFNPYRMSLVDVDWNFQGWGVMPLVTSDWNRFSDNDLRSELEAAKAALKAYMDDTTYGNNLTHWADPTNSAYREWDKYIGREDGSTGYIPGPNGEDALSLYGVIRARVMRLLSVMNPAYGLDGYLGVDPNFIMDQLTGAFNFPGSGPPGKPQADANDYNINTIGLYLLLATTEYRIDDKDDEIAFARRLLAAFRGLLIDYSSLHPTLLGEEDSDLPFPDTDFYPLREVDGGSAIVLKIKQDEFVVRYEHIENLINKLDTLVSSQLMTQLAPAFGLSSSGSSPSEAAPGTDTSSAPPPYYGPDAAFHVPRLEGHIIMRLGEMRYSTEECVIEDPNTGVKIVLPPLDTQLDPKRWVDEEANVKAQRRWIQSYRADVLLYLLHTIFEAIDTGDKAGGEMLAWLLSMFIKDGSSGINGRPASEYNPAPPAGVADLLGTAMDQVVNFTLGQVDLQAAMRPFLTDLVSGMVSGFLYSDTLPNTVLGLYPMLANLVAPIFDNKIFGDKVTDGALMEDIELFTIGSWKLTVGGLLTFFEISTVNDLLSSAIGKTLMEGLGGMKGGNVVNLLECLLGAELLPGELIRKCWPADWPTPANPNPKNMYRDINPNLLDIYMWLTNLNGKFGTDAQADPNRFSLNDGPSKNQNLGYRKTTLGSQEYKWARWHGPINSGTLNLSTPPKFGNINTPDVASADYKIAWPPVDFGETYKYNSLWAWYDVDANNIKANAVWGMEGLSGKAQRKAMEDIMAFTLSGMSLLLAGIFGDGGIDTHLGEGWSAGGAKNAPYYIDMNIMEILMTVLELIIQPLLDTYIGGFLGMIPAFILNPILDLLGPFNPKDIDLMGILSLIPGFSNFNETFTLMSIFALIDSRYTQDPTPSGLWPYFKGKYDSRAGVYANLTPVNAYGRLIIPLFEMLNIDPVLFGEYEGPEGPSNNILNQGYITAMLDPKPTIPIGALTGQFSEERFNQLMRIYGGNVSKIVFALNNSGGYGSGVGHISQAQAEETIKEISRVMVSAIFEPLMNWIDPVWDEAGLMKYSIGFRPVGKVLDLLPNLAFVTDNKIIPKLVNQVLGELQLTVEVCLGGITLDAIMDLIMDDSGGGLLNMIFVPITNMIGDALGDLLGLIFGPDVGGAAAPLLQYVVGLLLNNFVGSIITGFLNTIMGYADKVLVWFKNRIPDAAGKYKTDLGSLLAFFAGPTGVQDMLNIKIFDKKHLYVNPITGNPDDGLLNGVLNAPGANKDPLKATPCTDPKCERLNRVTGQIERITHQPGIFGFLEHMIGIDLTGRLEDLIQGGLGLAGIKDGVRTGDAPKIDQFYLDLVSNVVENQNHIMGFLVELFNPQTYPCTTFMIYPMSASLTGAGAPSTIKFNQVNYSDIWTRDKAEFLQNNLRDILDKWWDFLFAEPFMPWLWDMLNGLLADALGIDGFQINNLYTKTNLDMILNLLGGPDGFLSGLAPTLEGLFDNDIMKALAPLLNKIQHLVDIDDLFVLIYAMKYLRNAGAIATDLAGVPYVAKVQALVAKLNKSFPDGDRKAFSDALYALLEPLAPILKIFLTGGRTTDAKGNLIETIWYGELYPNNGARDIGYWDPNSSFQKTKPNETYTGDYVWNTKRYIKITDASYGVTKDIFPDKYPYVNDNGTMKPQPAFVSWQKAKPPMYFGPAPGKEIYDRHDPILEEGQHTKGNYKMGSTIHPNEWIYKTQKSQVTGFKPVYEQYGPNGSYGTVYDAKHTFYTIGAEGNNLTLIEDYLGFSGYDGYRQALIPIYEHLGVPKNEIWTFQQFVLRSTEGGDGYSGDALFFKMLVDPILNLLDRLVDDPINTLFDILPNLLYFLTAEATSAEVANGAMGGTTCINECLNRLLRPIYAILDMLGPLYTPEEILTVLLPAFGVTQLDDMLTDGTDGKKHLPLIVKLGDIELPINLPIEISVNTLLAGLLGSIDLMGLDLSALTDLTALIVGELELYQSQSGQDDAVRMKGKGDIPDLLTNLIRKLIEVIFTADNKPVVMKLITDLGVPDPIGPILVQLVENIYGLMADRTLKGHIGTDLVLSMLFYVVYDANSLADDLLFQRNAYGARMASFFEILAGNNSPQLRRYSERARRYLNYLYGDIMTPDNGVQKKGFIKFISDFWAKVVAFFTGIGDWFMRLFRWLFPFFF